jgi:hypothetical protein
MITIVHNPMTVWGGKILLTREFFNPTTRDYISLEAHEDENGNYLVAQFVPEGNNGSPWDAEQKPINLHNVVENMQNFTPPAGMIEMKIPDEAWA